MPRIVAERTPDVTETFLRPRALNRMETPSSMQIAYQCVHLGDLPLLCLDNSIGGFSDTEIVDLRGASGFRRIRPTREHRPKRSMFSWVGRW